LHINLGGDDANDQFVPSDKATRRGTGAAAFFAMAAGLASAV